MPKFTVNCSCSHLPQEAFQRIQERLPLDPDLSQLGGGLTFDFDGQNLTGTAVGSKFKAALTVRSSKPGSEVCIDVDIPFTLLPLRPMIQSTLEKKVHSYLA